AQAEDGAVRTHGNLRFSVPEAANPDGPRRRPVDLLHPPRFRTVAPGGGSSGTCAAAPLWPDFPRSPRSHPLRSRSPSARTSEAPVQFVFRAAPPVSGGVRSRRPPSECSMPSPHLRAHALGFAYPSTPSLFEDLSFHLPAGWTGLVGANGSGKSTLLGLLQGRLRPTFGQLERVPERQAIHLCPQEVERLDPVIEAFAEAHDGRSRQLHGRLGLEPWRLMAWDTLSPGERKRWQLGAALAQDPDVLLLDEPTNHLDAQARALLLDALRGFRGVGVVVSHDRAFLDALTSQTFRLHAGRLAHPPLPYSQARAAWEEERERDLTQRARAVERVAVLERGVERLQRAQRAVQAERSTSRRMRGRRDSDARTLAADRRVERAGSAI